MENTTEPTTPSTEEPTVMRPKLNPEPTSITIDIREEITEERDGDDDGEDDEPGRTRDYIDGLHNELQRSTDARMRGRRTMNKLMGLAELAADGAEEAVKLEGRSLASWGAALAAVVLSIVFSLLGWEVASNVVLLGFWALMITDLILTVRYHRARRRAAERARNLYRMMGTHIGY